MVAGVVKSVAGWRPCWRRLQSPPGPVLDGCGAGAEWVSCRLALTFCPLWQAGRFCVCWSRLESCVTGPSSIVADMSKQGCSSGGFTMDNREIVGVCDSLLQSKHKSFAKMILS